ncbi:RNA polymerase sigma factor [Phytohabitans rumicis]|nr:RNA polymerase sigma factor [Phytohabitans rumicis]
MIARARLRAGDESAFAELFDQYAQAVYRHAVRLTGDRSTAEDVVSATFLQAWRLRESIEADGGSLRPWLLGVATNTARNMTRKARRLERVLPWLSRPDVTPDFADEVAGRVDDAGRLALAVAALRGLRTAEREVVALCVWAGLDYAEAAEALGIPIGTVRSRLSRAREKLRKLSREPDRAPGQLDGGRIHAARPAQEGNR